MLAASEMGCERDKLWASGQHEGRVETSFRVILRKEKTFVAIARDWRAGASADHSQPNQYTD